MFWDPTSLPKNFKMRYQKEPSRVSPHFSLNWNVGHWDSRSGQLADFQISEVEYWTFHVCFKLNPKMQAVSAEVI